LLIKAYDTELEDENHFLCLQLLKVNSNTMEAFEQTHIKLVDDRT